MHAAVAASAFRYEAVELLPVSWTWPAFVKMGIHAETRVTLLTSTKRSIRGRESLNHQGANIMYW